MDIKVGFLEHDLSQHSNFEDTRDSANEMYAGKAVVVKAFIPQELILQFKIRCIQRDLRMSTVLEHLIRKWIESGSLHVQPTSHPSDEVIEEVKGYIPKSLKQRFKILCTQNQFQMSYVLHSLIEEWLALHE